MNKSFIAQLILRYGFTAVFIWFGLSQIMHPDMWTGLIPAWLTGLTGLSAHTFVLVNGSVEIILALCLALGLFVPIVAVLLSLHLFTIAADLGLTAVGVRDIGLALAVLALAFLSADKLDSLDKPDKTYKTDEQ